MTATRLLPLLSAASLTSSSAVSINYNCHNTTVAERAVGEWSTANPTSTIGKLITLTLGTSLQAATSYAVTAENITTPAGRVIPASFNRTFQTWDNDPGGILVFILAGQSNMVGHGKSEAGANPAYNPSLPTGPDNPREIPGGPGCLRNLAVNDDLYPEVDYRRLLVDPAQPATSAWKSRSDVNFLNHNGESQYLNGTAMGWKMLEMLTP
jgi:hypothetical protein